VALLLRLTILSVIMTLICCKALYNIQHHIYSFPDNKIPISNESVVNVDYICSGVIVQRDLVLTAAHCISDENVDLITVIFSDSSSNKFDLRYIGKPGGSEDFAILIGDTGNRSYLPIAHSMPDPFSEIAHVGYSGTSRQWVTPGIYLGEFRYPFSGIYEFTAGCRVIPGDSGGAFINELGEVIGIAWGSYWPINVGVAFMAPVENIKDKLNELDIKWER